MPRLSVPVFALLVFSACEHDGGVYDELEPVGPEEQDLLTSGECRSQGYWGSHGDAWPAYGFDLGGEWYDKEELLELMHTPANGNACLILAYQLIAAKLNHAVSGNVYDVEHLIRDADKMLGGLGRLPDYEVSPGTELGGEMVELAGQLEIFNTTEGCGDPYGGSGDSGGWDPAPVPFPYRAVILGVCEGPYGCDRVELAISLTDVVEPPTDLYIHELELHGDGPWRFGVVEGVWSDGYEANWTGDLSSAGAQDIAIRAVDVSDTHAPIHLRLQMTSHGQPEELDDITVTLHGSSAPLDQAHQLVDHQGAVTPP